MVGHIADRDLLTGRSQQLTPRTARSSCSTISQTCHWTRSRVIWGISAGTARSRLHYALRSLRATLEAADRGAAAELGR